MNRRRLRADRLIDLGVRGELRRRQRRHLIGGGRNQPSRRARSGRIAGAQAEPIACRSLAAAVSICGCVVTNDIRFLLPSIVALLTPTAEATNLVVR